jgi:carboxypeptidase C (cathepsin A)
MLISRRGVTGLGLAVAAVPHLARAAPLPGVTAKAAKMPISQGDGPPDAEIFHVSYIARGADPAKRPVTFVFNGVYDMDANYMMPRYLLGEVTRDRSARDRTSFHTYTGGHMFYLRTRSRAELAGNVRRVYSPMQA